MAYWSTRIQKIFRGFAVWRNLFFWCLILIKKRREGYVDDRSYFGDGWLWAGTTILYLTGLIHRYRLLDPTLYLDKLQRLYPENLNKIQKKKKKKKGRATGDETKE